jgi:hypothetical protein
MLHLLRDRVSKQGDLHRLKTTCADARIFGPPTADYDLVVTHFFLDCLTECETDRLITRLRPHLAPRARWLVSEFQVPRTGVVQTRIAQAIIFALYAGFRLLTGLTIRKVPPWRMLLACHGFTRKASRSWLGGLIVSELWEIPLEKQPRIVLKAST